MITLLFTLISTKTDNNMQSLLSIILALWLLIFLRSSSAFIPLSTARTFMDVALPVGDSLLKVRGRAASSSIISIASGANDYVLAFDAEKSRVHFSSNDEGTEEVVCLLSGLSPDSWSAAWPSPPSTSSRISSSNGIFLHSSHPIPTSTFDTSLGKLSSCHRLLACARLTRYWMGPAFASDVNNVPLDTQFLLVEIKEGGPYALMLPLLDGDFRASLYGDSRKSELICHQESGDASVVTVGTRAIYLAVDHDPYRLLKEGFATVAEETKTFFTLDQKELPPTVDEFGWCTWDAFYSSVTPQGVLDAVTSLRNVGIQPRTVILDDGWQQVEPTKKAVIVESGKAKPVPIVSTLANVLLGIVAKVMEVFYERCVRKSKHNSIPNRIWRFLTSRVLKGQLWDYFDTETDFARQMSGFEPNQKFQENADESATSLKNLVSRLKTEFGVKQLYCWHALHGYWRGISPTLGIEAGINATNVMPQLSEHLLRVEPVLAWDAVSLFGVGLVPDEGDLSILYENLHAPLVLAGVDGVKVDVQSGVSSLGGGISGGSRIARVYTRALENSVSTKFASPNGAAGCINCMCHSTENLYRYQQTSVARASDDFYPRRPNSHTVHLVNVAYNSLFIGEICLPDWDMFHSKHVSAGLHAAARAVSGGPVYVSDAPGQHDAELLKRLVLEDGSILRALLPGRPTRDSLFADVGQDGANVMKVWNKNQHGGVIATFNVQGVAWNFQTHENEVVIKHPPILSASIRPYDIENLRETQGPFVAFDHRSSSLTFLPDGNSTIETELPSREWDIVTVVPVQQCSSNDIAWAPIGLSDMLNTGGAVSDVSDIATVVREADMQSSITTFTSRGPGRFIAYCQPKPTHVSLTGGTESPSRLPFTHDSQLGLLSFTLPSEKGEPHSVKLAWE